GQDARRNRAATRRPTMPDNLCLDKGYDYEKPEREARRRHVEAHIRRRGEPALTGPIRCKKARRWVVERTNSWHNNFRALRIRWERIADHHLAFVQLTCAMICHRAEKRG